jgi:phospholipid/cholesterol/gamma-HCH transport system substrate-binding protein
VSYLGADRYVKIVPGKSGVIPGAYQGRSESLELEAIVSKLDSLSSFIGNLKLPDLSNIGKDLSRSLDQNVKELAGMFREPGDKIGGIVTRLDSLIVELSDQLHGDGSVGKLLKSDELYNEILQTNQSLRALLDDIKANPKKYVNIKVF